MFSNLASYIFGSSSAASDESSNAGSNVPTTTSGDSLIISSNSSVVPSQVHVQPDDRPYHQVRREESGASSEDDWVVVGGGGHAPALGSLNDMIPRPSTGSTGSSATPSEEDYPLERQEDVQEEGGEMVVVHNEQEGGEEEQVLQRAPLSRSGRRLTAPFSCQNAVISLAQMKASRSAQTARLKEVRRSNTAKATNRQNKAVKHQKGFSKKTKSCRDNLAMKASGFQKQLKQC